MAVEEFWVVREEPYQNDMKIIDAPDQPSIKFPLVIAPSKQATKDEILKEIAQLAAQPSDTSGHSKIRELLDANGGAINIKGLPLKDPEDFSEFLSALAGKGEGAWYPHVHVGMEVLRRPLAKNVMTTNEGPPSHFIGWHNEYAVSPVHPGYLILFCQIPPGRGGETNITSSVALYDRLKKSAPEFVEKCGTKGLVYHIPHTASQVGGIVGGNGLYKANAFGPSNGEDVSTWSEERKKKHVEERILDLAKRGGWSEEASKDVSLPEWQRRGFDWTWEENGDLNVVHRVPGTRIHPTSKLPTIFNAMSTRYTNAKVNNTWEPPHTYKTKDGEEATAIPPYFAGIEKDEPIAAEWLAKMDEWQHKLGSDISWQAGDVLIIDNFAVQHARWAWEGDRKVHASFWDQAGFIGQQLPTSITV
ncbi:Clavaminate synthase-like protein [Pseudovirgaria hyperparasitica]|uniref:Clavaminate synthase-like protein n=1 Tax=Pseudovirgaria hyperparasitica TaxID=470096 RepID=A0A6A6VSD4_9PEZI|nr:Clavaminate synthase-like protein [Pseudovirgaria hyperparasitica]KAF2753578.1 Clavaminate synthase-like protein [Pseudovirgaria hyperparasitica]